MSETQTVEIGTGEVMTIQEYKDTHLERLKEATFTTLPELYDEIHDYLYSQLDLIEERHYHILTAWALHTWKIEQLQETGYLLFRGNKGSGKTRAMRTLQHITMGAMDASLISTPAIYRLLRIAPCTFYLDEFDKYSKEKAEALIGVLNSGYERGGQVLLCDQHDKNTVKGYPTFGAKAIGMIGGVDGAFLSRCIFITMIRNIRAVNFRIDTHRAGLIKSKMEQWRIETYNDPIEDTEELFKANGIKNYRLIQILNSLASVVPKDKRIHILKYAEEEQNQIDEDEGTEIFIQLYHGVEIQLKQTPGFILVSQITDLYNSNKKEYEQLSPHKIGALLTTMGLTKKKRTKIGMGRIVSPHIQKRLAKRWKRTPTTLEEVVNK